jgi:hypothetical protein
VYVCVTLNPRTCALPEGRRVSRHTDEHLRMVPVAVRLRCVPLLPPLDGFLEARTERGVFVSAYTVGRTDRASRRIVVVR